MADSNSKTKRPGTAGGFARGPRVRGGDKGAPTAEAGRPKRPARRVPSGDRPDRREPPGSRPFRPPGRGFGRPWEKDKRSLGFAGGGPPVSEDEALETATPAATIAPREVSALALATRVVGGVDKEHPADAVLRVVLKEERGLRRATAGEVARLVFGFFRWRGFVGRGLPLERQIESTADMARRYAVEPETVAPQGLGRAVPAWVRDRVAGGEAWWGALQREPRLWLRARPGTSESVKLSLGDVEQPYPAEVPDALAYVGAKDLFRDPGFQAGHFEIQDLASQIVGLLCAPKAGETWWDACAGEGGKTLHLADLMANRGTVWATDRAAWRLQRLRVRAGRAKLFNIRWAEWDGGETRPGGMRFDGVLVDAPCSGLGTWQRNPHGRWACTPEDVAEMAALQARLLKHAAAGVKPGGRLIYSVCTLTHEETTRIADGFEAAVPGFEPAPLPDAFRRGPGSGSATTGTHRVWLWPQDWGGNGMFVAAWTRKKGA